MSDKPDDEAQMQASAALTLRDYFAAKAMQALICSPDTQLHEEWPTHMRRAEFAYEQADAMIEARKS